MGKKCTPNKNIGFREYQNIDNYIKIITFFVKKKNLIGHVPIFEKVVHSSFHFNNHIKIEY